MPWEKKEKLASANAPVSAIVGAVAVYRVKITKDADGQDDWTFTQLWVKGFALQTGCLHWADEEDILYIGFDQGKIVRLKISDKNPMQYNQVSRKVTLQSAY